MYIRRTLSKSGKRRKKYYTYRLVESYRIADKVRQRTLLSLGSDFNLPKEQWIHLTGRIEDILLGRNALLEADKNIEVIAQSCASKIIDKRSIASEDGDTRYTPVDIDAIETLRSRSIGNETILKESMDELDLPSLFDRLGFSTKQKKSLLGLLMAKAISPGSERSMHEWLRYNSAAGELLECDYDKISLSSLYRSTDLIKVHKDEIEHHLYTKQKGLLGFEESITLFDLTNSYFEGEAKGIDKAHRGRSKEKRSDAPLITLALVLNGNGAIRHSDIYAGNISEASTFTEMFSTLDYGSKEDSLFSSSLKPIVVMDAGIATQANVDWLKENAYRYIVVSRKRHKEFDEEKSVIVNEARDNKEGSEVKAQKVINASGEVELYCKSQRRSAKEEAMFARSRDKFIQELEKLKEGLSAPRRTKNYDKIMEKIGRLKERYSYAAQYYDINVKKDTSGKLAVDIEHKEKKDIHDKLLHYGVYCLRSNLTEMDEERLWNTYITLTDIEAVFRSLKSELGLRPIYHKKGQRVDSHIILTLMAYTLIHTIRTKLAQKEIHKSWESIRQNLSSLKRSTIVLPTPDGVVHQRQNDTPQPEHRVYFDALGISFIKGRVRTAVEG